MVLSQVETWQCGLDMLIFLSYVSIPISMVYFLRRKRGVLPLAWLAWEFGAFIALCGITHLLNVVTTLRFDERLEYLQAATKSVTALVSLLTAIAMLKVIPEILDLKDREICLRNRSDELDLEMGNIKAQEELGRRLYDLTNNIRSTLDRRQILKTTFVELVRMLQLYRCCLWTQDKDDDELWILTYEIGVDNGHDKRTMVVPKSHTKAILETDDAVRLEKGSQIAEQRPNAIAVRVPLLTDDSAESFAQEVGYGILVLTLPADSDKSWGPQELQIAGLIAVQVSVALSHVTILEDSMKIRGELVARNAALDEARTKAESAIQARDDFLAVMNHEMRTPLHAIVALTSLLHHDQSLSQDQKSMVDTINRSGALLQTLINDILDFSRLESGKLKLERRIFNIRAMFEEARTLVLPNASSKEIEISLRVDPAIPTEVIGDEQRLLQVILNLLSNAVKFTDDGRIAIGVNLETKRVVDADNVTIIRVHVEDTGVGIDPDQIGFLFQKFIQADSSTTRRYGGTGLGLAVCRKFVELMGGTIRIESDGEGRGTRVTFTVQVLQPGLTRPPTGKQAPKWERTESFKCLRVLLTDDNHVNCMVTKRLLQKIGCQTTVVNSGAQCLAKLERGERYAVLLLDISMPFMDGYEVCQRIIDTYEPEQRPKIIALTANTDKATRVKCEAIGMDGVLLKPVSIEQILDAFRKVNIC